jgi:hypothetical protein
MEIPSHLDPTIVTANGAIVHVGKSHDGLVVVDSDTQKPVISFDEVTGDEEVIHIFCKFAEGAAFGGMNDEMDDSDHEIVGSDGIENTHEIILRK